MIPHGQLLKGYLFSILPPLLCLFTTKSVYAFKFSRLPHNIDLNASLTESLLFDDNFYEDHEKKSTGIYSIIPRINYRFGHDLNKYSLEASIDHTIYTHISVEPATDYQLQFTGHHEFTSRHRLDAKITAGYYTDEGIKSANDKRMPEYHQIASDLTYGFGSLQTRSRIDFFANAKKKSYTTDGFNGSHSVLLGSTLYHRVATRTDLLLEASHETQGYDDGESPENYLTSYLTGISLRPSAKTSGYIKIGQRHRKTKTSPIVKNSYTGWETGATHNIRSYSKLSLEAKEDYNLHEETPEQTLFAKEVSIRLRWDHKWNSRFGTYMMIEGTKEDILGCGAKLLKEAATYTYTTGFQSQPKYWLDFAFSWEHIEHYEHIKYTYAVQNNYRKNVVQFSATITI